MLAEIKHRKNQPCVRDACSKSVAVGLIVLREDLVVGKQSQTVPTEDTRLKQICLKKERFDPGPIDGIDGSRTKAALALYGGTWDQLMTACRLPPLSQKDIIDSKDKIINTVKKEFEGHEKGIAPLFHSVDKIILNQKEILTRLNVLPPKPPSSKGREMECFSFLGCIVSLIFLMLVLIVMWVGRNFWNWSVPRWVHTWLGNIFVIFAFIYAVLSLWRVWNQAGGGADIPNEFKLELYSYVAFWLFVPPLWYFIDYFSISSEFITMPNANDRENYLRKTKDYADLGSKVWAAVLAALYFLTKKP